MSKDRFIRRLSKKCHLSLKDTRHLYDLMTDACIEELLENKELDLFNIMDIQLEQVDISNVKLKSSFTFSIKKKIRSLIKQG